MNEQFYNTFRWSVTIGTTAGYALEGQRGMDAAAFSEIFQKIIEEEAHDSGVWVTAVIAPSRTVYLKSAGCPPEGERTYTLTGGCNPAFTSPDKYLPALRRVVKKLKFELHQTTVLLEITPAHAEYFQGD